MSIKTVFLLILCSINCKLIAAHWVNNNTYSIETTIDQSVAESRVVDRYDEKVLVNDETYETSLANRTFSSYSLYPGNILHFKGALFFSMQNIRSNETLSRT